MTYIYVDESGDLGFDFSKGGASEKFSIAFLITNNRQSINALVKKTFLSLPPAIKRKFDGVLHAKKEKSSTVKRLLKKLSSKDIYIASICLDKRKMLVTTNQNDLYAYMLISLINRLYSDDVFKDSQKINLVVSQRHTNKHLNERFFETLVASEHGTQFTVNIVKPASDKCLQAVDFVSWALWQKYEKNDSTYSDLFSDRIICEYNMYS